ncbi:hypothetical protein [Fodinicola feengrottensis]|uniref:hypothetical protein n=1 Tax=Fodinicola feengrottensis TaxID=435914 RepID=UPI0013D0EA63|nr:hypothetical protein [Fodinicola feengrottensis]
MSISDALAFARSRGGGHDHVPGKTYEIPDRLVLGEGLMVGHLVSNCQVCAQTVHALTVYNEGERVKTTTWMSNGECASAAWNAGRL